MMSVFGWLVTYLIHSTLLLSGAWLCDRFLLRGRPHWQEFVWRVALVGGLVTATAQSALPLRPVAGTLSLERLNEQTSNAQQAAGPITTIVIQRGGEPRTVVISREPAAVFPVAMATSPRVFPWQTAALSVWGVGAVALLGALGLSWRSLRRRIEDRRRLEGEPIGDVLAELAARKPVVRAPLISATDEVPVPMALGLRRPEILLPERVALELSVKAQESVLAHELGHIVRRDPLYRLLVAAFVRVFFFQPLNFVAARKLAAAAEQLADDWAAERTARPLDLAECLTKVARWAMVSAPPSMVPAMALGTSELRQRVERLVKGEWLSMRTKRTVWALPIASIVLTALYLLAPCATGVAEAKDKPPKPPTMVRAATLAPPAPPAPPLPPARAAEVDDEADEDEDEACEAQRPAKRHPHGKHKHFKGRHFGRRFASPPPPPAPPAPPPPPPHMFDADDFDVFVMPPLPPMPPPPPPMPNLDGLHVDVDVDVDMEELHEHLAELHEQMSELREKIRQKTMKAVQKEMKQARKEAEKARKQAQRETERARRRAQMERDADDDDADDDED